MTHFIRLITNEHDNTATVNFAAAVATNTDTNLYESDNEYSYMDLAEYNTPEGSVVEITLSEELSDDQLDKIVEQITLKDYEIQASLAEVVDPSSPSGALFLKNGAVIVGQDHGKPPILSPDTLERVKAIAAEHGAWYEGDGKDAREFKEIAYTGSFDDEIAKNARPDDYKWVYVLFSNVDANNRIQQVGVDPKDTIFNRLLASAKATSYQGIGFTAGALTKFLEMASEAQYNFVEMSEQPATEENVTNFFKSGEALMWPDVGWEQYPHKAGKIAKAATVDVRDPWLANAKPGVYVVGSGHLVAVQELSGADLTEANLTEATNENLVIIYPGRFHPFHKGHHDVFKLLQKRAKSNHYSGVKNNSGVKNAPSSISVFIATSDKQEPVPGKSPFSFEEKLEMIKLTGISSDSVVCCQVPYQATDITDNYDMNNTVVLYAISEKDMAEDPRFNFPPKGTPSLRKDDQPAHMQRWDTWDNASPLAKHSYVDTVPTITFNVMGEPADSATEIRQRFPNLSSDQQKTFISDLFGNYSDSVLNIMRNKLGDNNER